MGRNRMKMTSKFPFHPDLDRQMIETILGTDPSREKNKFALLVIQFLGAIKIACPMQVQYVRKMK